ncbi:MAG: S41 family peptidase, partial [bacterium]|nr:S41 family peptidase [bacterium]
MIDTYWGEGESTEEKLRIFDKFWSYADSKYAAFQGVDVDWNALRTKYRPEVAAGVSRGRFAAIMNQLAIALREPHTQALDLVVNVFTVPEPGVPSLAVGDTSFNPSGACTTTQADGTSLVYSAMPDHPLGLEPGDVVLGYEGRPWNVLYKELLAEEIPLWPLYWGGSTTSFAHSFQSSATINWHLFDSIDVQKASGSVVSVPTNLMPGPLWYGFCSEQLPIAGVDFPVGTWEQAVSSGVVAGTNVGYVYVWAWGPDSEIEFESQLRELIQVRGVDSLIIDFRFNTGGFLHASQKGLAALFDHPQPTVGFDIRRV